MRDMKFKGKNKDIGWVYGQLVYDVNGNAYIIQEVELDSSYGLEETMLYATMWYRVENETIGQYTGLKDKNGKEIYEGDIVLTQPFRDKPYSKKYKEKRLKGIVKYNIKCGDNFCGCEGKMKYWGAEWQVEIIDKEDYKKFANYDWGRFFDCEVIGNIYDNPKLLEEGE